MVRTIAGTLMDVGHGRRPAHSIDAMLAARDRAQAGQRAPAHGLFAADTPAPQKRVSARTLVRPAGLTSRTSRSAQ